MKYNLKSHMLLTGFSVNCEKTSEGYQVYIYEKNNFSGDEQFYHLVKTEKLLKDAEELQRKVYTYMSNENFSKVIFIPYRRK